MSGVLTTEKRNNLMLMQTFHLPRLEEVLKDYTAEELSDFYSFDPWYLNYILNIWEFIHGEVELKTYPWNVCIPIVDYCNASCSFCNSWLRGERYLRLEELENFRPLLQKAKLLGLAGHGEPLIHPQFDQFALRLRQLLDPRCAIYLITNGQYIQEHFDSLKTLRVRTYNISLNAASDPTHQEIMEMTPGSFQRVLQAIEQLVKLRKKGAKDAVEVNISLVIVKQNVHELADFIELGNRLGVDHVYLRTLQPVGKSAAGLNYHLLPPYLHPEYELHGAKAIDAINTSKVPVSAEPDTWGTRIFPPEVEAELEKIPPKLITRGEARKSEEIRAVFDSQKPGQDVGDDPMKLRFEVEYERRNLEDPYGRKPRFECRFIYYNLNLNDFYFALNPCCYMERVPGHAQVYFDGKTDFFEAWNSEAFVELRRRLVEGPLYSYCRKCPFQG